MRRPIQLVCATAKTEDARVYNLAVINADALDERTQPFAISSLEGPTAHWASVPLLGPLRRCHELADRRGRAAGAHELDESLGEDRPG
jgi:hypothetical protein